MFSESTSHIATWQPSAVSCPASARPIPVPPPVMTANLSRKSFIEIPFPVLSPITSAERMLRALLSRHPPGAPGARERL